MGPYREESREVETPSHVSYSLTAARTSLGPNPTRIQALSRDARCFSALPEKQKLLVKKEI